jgi:hypothetical protein
MSGAQFLSDEDFLAAFFECRLPASDFDHRAHVRMAWLVLQRHPTEEAVELVCTGIMRFAAHLGAAEKFNRTLSEALVRLMADSGTGNHSMRWDEFTHRNQALMSDVPGLLARHYSAERLSSPEAKQRFIEPDRLPLPVCRTSPLEH